MDPEFDDSVLRALEKWPDVPACYGWLRLDRRGRWLIRDQTISHRGALAFLGRNYGTDAHGQWYVQNGPQRAYCSLDYTPWIYHLDGHDRLFTHTGKRVSVLRGFVVDDDGDLLCETEHGIGLVQDRDLGRFLELLEEQAGGSDDDDAIAESLARLDPASGDRIAIVWDGRRVPVSAMRAQDVPAAFGFVPTPLPRDDGDQR